MTGPAPDSTALPSEEARRPGEFGLSRAEPDRRTARAIDEGRLGCEIAAAHGRTRTAVDYESNPNSGAIAPGHPPGAFSARLRTTPVHHVRDNGIRFGLRAMSEGGGTSEATFLGLI